VFLENRWHIFDARHNIPRCGRVLIARGAMLPMYAPLGSMSWWGLRSPLSSLQPPRCWPELTVLSRWI
jgi:hypothetical protein